MPKYHLIVALGARLTLHRTPASGCITELGLIKRREVRKLVKSASAAVAIKAKGFL